MSEPIFTPPRVVYFLRDFAGDRQLWTDWTSGLVPPVGARVNYWLDSMAAEMVNRGDSRRGQADTPRWSDETLKEWRGYEALGDLEVVGHYATYRNLGERTIVTISVIVKKPED